MKKFIVKTIWVLLLVIAIFVVIGIVLPYNKNGYMRAFITKEKTIENPNREPMVLLVGGSSVAFGYSCKMLTDSLNRPVFNTGLHAGLGSKCMVDEITYNVKEGDVVILALEEFSYTKNGMQNGESILADAALLHPNVIKRFSLGQWLTFIGGIPQFVKAKCLYALSRKKNVHLELVEGYDCRGFDEYGDYTLHYNKPCHNTKITEKSTVKAEMDYHFIEYVKNKIQVMESKGAKVLMVPATQNQSSYNNQKEKIDDITVALSRSDIPYVCSQDCFILPDSLYYDTQRHLGYEGTLLRTKRTIGVLKPLLE